MTIFDRKNRPVEGLRLGLTMRVARITETGETRDALAQDWSRFLSRALPEAAWTPVPNLGEQAVSHLEQWGLNGLIFTGGDDLGAEPSRDATEHALLTAALDRRIPVFGVCRGLHFLQQFFGGSVTSCNAEAHVAKRHEILLEDPPCRWNGSNSQDVNSYHRYCVLADRTASPLQVFAHSKDGCAEGIRHPHLPLLGVQWHPEREPIPRDFDLTLIRTFLGLAVEVPA